MSIKLNLDYSETASGILAGEHFFKSQEEFLQKMRKASRKNIDFMNFISWLLFDAKNCPNCPASFTWYSAAISVSGKLSYLDA